MADKQTFRAVLEKHERWNAAAITVPFDVEEVFGAKRVPVLVSINGAEHRSTVHRMGGKYLLAVPKAFREAAGVKAGDRIEVTIRRDTEKRTVEIPKDLSDKLKENNLTDVFEKMSYTHQKEFVNAVNEAKKEETRIRRIEKTIGMLKKKQDNSDS